MKYLETVSRGLVMAGLSVVFLVYFCEPSYRHYTDRQTFLAESSSAFSESMLPAVSVWRQPDSVELLYQRIADGEESCYSKEDPLQLVTCLERNTANLSSLVSSVGQEDEDVTFNVSSLWEQSYGIIMKGRVYRLDRQYRLSDKVYTDFTFLSPPDGAVSVDIHDPHFYLHHSERVKTFQSVRLELVPGTRYTLFLDLVELELLDTDARPCESGTGYSFTSCLQLLRKLERIHAELGLLSLVEIGERTGCRKPCKYRLYSQFQDVKRTKHQNVNQSRLSVILSSSEVTTRKENLVYPLPSFVSEVGGALGLFLGFSFLSLWDLIQSLLSIIYTKTANKDREKNAVQNLTNKS